MTQIFLQKTKNRKEFLKRVFKEKEVEKEIERAKRVLIKPNIVSYEPYPTTTHPELIEGCLEYFLSQGKKVLVGDCPAPDAGNSEKILKEHSLEKICNKFNLSLMNLCSRTRKVKTSSLELEVSEIPFEVDFILSLPVLKSHSICKITGALKNQFGLISQKNRLRIHRSFRRKLLHKVIAELNLIFKPNFFIVDAIETLINTNEIRHGGKLRKLGYMLAGKDPVALDIEGLKLLQKIDLKLKNKKPEDILHLKYALDSKIGSSKYCLKIFKSEETY